MNIECFESMIDYGNRFPNNFRYAFMLIASTPISEVVIQEPFSLFLEMKRLDYRINLQTYVLQL